MTVKRTAAATGYGFAVMFVYGVAVVMIGTLLPEMISSFDLSLARGGLVVTLQNLGGFVVLALGVALADRLPKAPVILVSFAVLGVLLLATGAVRSYGLLLAVFLLSGAVLRILDTMLNAFIGDIRSLRRGYYMNLLHMCFGIGAACGPLFASAVLGAGGNWRSAYIIIAAVFGLVFIPGIFIMRRRDFTAEYPASGDEPVHGNPAAPAGRSRILPAGSGLIPAGLGLFFYGMHQSGVTAWLPYYMGAALASDRLVAGSALSIYWGGIIISRVTASRLSACVPPAKLITAGSLAGGVLLGAGLLSSAAPIVITASLASGILSGATIPLFLTLIHQRHPLNTGTTTAVLMLFMLAGRLAAPWLMGAIADSGNPRASMFVAVAALPACAVAAICGSLRARSSGSSAT